MRVSMHSTEKEPRSTKSPLKRYLLLMAGLPFSLKMLIRSKYCPWMSPQTVISS
jgi:hypothetical protein